MVRTRDRANGFVLLDAIMALALMTGTVMLMLTLFRAEVRDARDTHERFAALLIAESEMERLKTLPWEKIVPGEAQPLALTLPSAARIKAVAATLSVAERGPGMKTARVRVEWESSKGRPVQVELTCDLTEGLAL